MLKIFPAFVLIACFVTPSFAQPGTLDSGFGLNGTTTLLPQPILNKAYSVIEQPDHKILVAGYAIAGSNNEFVLARLLQDGSPDPDFGTNGIIQKSIGYDALCYSMALQPDGKIHLVGGASLNSNASKDFAVLRLLPSGVPDSSFSSDGIQTTSFGSGDDLARSVLIQPDGKILVAGTSTNGNNSLMAIARFLPDGALDATFSGDGKNTLGIGTIFTNGYAMALLPDGKILLTGAAKFGMADDVALARFLPNGLVDNTFGTSGYVVTNLGSDADSGNAIAVQKDGKIVIAGITGADRDFAVLRYLSNGMLDPDFGNQGVVTSDFLGSDDYANAVSLQPDGKILVGGYAYDNSKPNFALARYLSDGTPDPDFGINGQVTTDFSNGYDYGFPMALQSDGKVLQSGYSYFDLHTSFAIARYLTGLNLGVLDLLPASLCFISPNPIAENAVFEFETMAPDQFSLDLIDFSGRVVQSLFVQNNLQAGKHAIPIRLSGEIAPGWYVLRLKGATNQWTLKVLKH